jgi:hypothetical protein
VEEGRKGGKKGGGRMGWMRSKMGVGRIVREERKKKRGKMKKKKKQIVAIER